MATAITLAGVELALKRGQSIEWAFTVGVKADQMLFTVPTKVADAVMLKAAKQWPAAERSFSRSSRYALRGSPPTAAPQGIGPLTLKFEPTGAGSPVEIKGLYVLKRMPASDFRSQQLLVTDRRFLWRRALIERSYNKRRRTGTVRLVSGELVKREIQQEEGDVDYVEETLLNNRKWRPRDILKDILSELCGEDGFALPDSVELQDSVQGFNLRDNGEVAMARALAFIPGVGTVPDEAGLIQVVNTLDQSARLVFQKLEEKAVDFAGHWQVVDNSLIRPSVVRVSFDMEQEIRFDYEEGSLSGGVRGSDPPLIENVIPISDPTMVVDGETLAAGTLLTVDKWLRAIRALDDRPPEKPLFTQEIIRQAYIAGLGYLHKIYALALPGVVNKLWADRIQAVQEHWRILFRVWPTWMDKIRSIKAYRVAIVDVENLARGDAHVWCNWTVKPSHAGLTTLGNDDAAWSHDVYADVLDGVAPAPFKVQMVDEQLGLFTIAPRIDLAGMGTRIIPGSLTGETPKMKAGLAVMSWSNPKRIHLDSVFKLAVILTVTRETPNDRARLWEEEVNPLVLGTELTKSLAGVGDLGPSNGPEWDVFSSLDTARFAWIDGPKDADGVPSIGKRIKESVWNGTAPEPSWMVNKDIIVETALATAAQIYAVLLDRAEGSVTTVMTPGLVPTGSIRRVTHGVRRLAGGTGIRIEATTRVEAPPIVDQIPVSALLPEALRETIRGFVQR